MNEALSTARSPSEASWFATWFDSAHYHRLYAHRNDGEAKELIDHLIERGHLRADAHVLDLGCGTGRHARYLASRGFHVTGLDLSAESLRLARQREGPSLRFVRQDMRLPFRTGTFDHILNLFTSFGYFEDPADNVSVIHNIATALRSTGCLVLDYLNVRYAETHLNPDEILDLEGTVYRVSRWSDREHIFKRVVIVDGSETEPLAYTERVAKLTVEDFRFMFSVCGLTLQASYGDYRLSPFDEQTSARLILVATKLGAPSRNEPLPRQFLSNAADRFGRHAEV